LTVRPFFISRQGIILLVSIILFLQRDSQK
jgi:hypothetical protein